jgi:hypothetical protein
VVLDLAPDERHHEEQGDGEREPSQGRVLRTACVQRSFGSPARTSAAAPS